MRGTMDPKDRKLMAETSPSRSILPPPNASHPTLQVPCMRTDVGTLRDLLDSGPSPTVSHWPNTPASSDSLDGEAPDSGDRRPTPPAFVVPEVPSKCKATLTLVRGIDAGRVFRLDRTTSIVGRGFTSDVRLDDPAVSRCHASLTRRSGDRYVIEDLGSTNGTFVRGRPISRLFLTSGDRIQLGPNVAFRFSLLTEDENSLQQTLFELAVRDGLTGVFNRPSLTKLIDDALMDASVAGHALSVLMIDLDHFKNVNDELGHAAGDETLRAVAEAMLRVVRTRDSVARYGGEEFVVLARATDRADACRLAERLRLAIASIRIATERGIAMTTASIGVASLSECEACHGENLLELADARMYEAKRLGRNRVSPAVP